MEGIRQQCGFRMTVEACSLVLAPDPRTYFSTAIGCIYGAQTDRPDQLFGATIEDSRQECQLLFPQSAGIMNERQRVIDCLMRGPLQEPGEFGIAGKSQQLLRRSG